MDIKAARQKYDCQAEIDKLLGPARGNMYLCPFHEERTPSFHVFQNGYHCFGCGEHGDLFDFWAHWYKRPLGEILREQHIDPQEEIIRKQEYLERQAIKIQKDLDDLQTKIRELQSGEAWLRYNENERETRIKLWEKRGIPEWYQDWTYFGYDPSHRFWIGEEYFSPTLTFPVYEPGGTRKVLNIRHRLLRPRDDTGKYRPEYSGLPASLFVADPESQLEGGIILVEGEIKAAVTWITAQNNMQVAGSPSKNLSKSMFDQLSECNPIYYIPDPDVTREEIIKTRNALKGRDFFVAKLPQKIDDMIIDAGLGKHWIDGVLASARKI